MHHPVAFLARAAGPHAGLSVAHVFLPTPFLHTQALGLADAST
jgi:hypothetical protein